MLEGNHLPSMVRIGHEKIKFNQLPDAAGHKKTRSELLDGIQKTDRNLAWITVLKSGA